MYRVSCRPAGTSGTNQRRWLRIAPPTLSVRLSQSLPRVSTQINRRLRAFSGCGGKFRDINVRRQQTSRTPAGFRPHKGGLNLRAESVRKQTLSCNVHFVQSRGLLERVAICGRMATRHDGHAAMSGIGPAMSDASTSMGPGLSRVARHSSEGPPANLKRRGGCGDGHRPRRWRPMSSRGRHGSLSSFVARCPTPQPPLPSVFRRWRVPPGAE